MIEIKTTVSGPPPSLIALACQVVFLPTLLMIIERGLPDNKNRTLS